MHHNPWHSDMDPRLHFLMQHGYSVLFFWVLGEQLGLPIPAMPMLIAAGALSASGEMGLVPSIFLGLLACLISDGVWYEAGRRRGSAVLHLLCKLSLEPDSCVRQTQTAFSNQGSRVLVLAKFIPGLNTIAPPMSAISGVSRRRFIVFDAAGSLLWSAAFIGLGYVFSKQVDMVIAKVLNFFGSFVLAVALLVALYIGWKYINRQLFIRKLRVARISAGELKSLLADGKDVFIVDLRHPADFEQEPLSITGALRVLPAELELKHEQIPRDRDVILYCT